MIRSSRKYVRAAVIFVVLAVVIVAGTAILKKHDIDGKRKARTDENAKGPVVEVTTVKPASNARHVTLIGETRSYFETTLYAKVSGYLKNLRVDKGDAVKEGDLLAVIESPETDKAYLSALADYVNKHRIAGRYRVLIKRKLISQQEADQAFANEDISRQFLETQRVLKGYEQIRAPFSGIVTARYVDPGALIQSAQGSQSGSQAVVTVSQTDHLRVWAYVDQKDAPYVRTGMPVTIRSSEPVGQEFQARVTRTAAALDPRTRTLLAEIDLVGAPILSGSFVEVAIDIPEKPGFEVPARALVLQGSKSLIPLVDEHDHIHYQPIRVESNDGQTIRISDGIREGERIALSVGNTINDGDAVRVKQTEMAGQKPPIVQSQN